MSAHTSVAVGMKGASKAMSAMNKVRYMNLLLTYDIMNDIRFLSKIKQCFISSKRKIKQRLKS